MSNAEKFRKDIGGKRYYETPSGKLLPSVTTILSILDKPALIQWSANVSTEFLFDEIKKRQVAGNFDLKSKKAQELLKEAKRSRYAISKQATDIGTSVHNAIEDYINTGKKATLTNEKAKLSFSSFFKWADENKFKPLETEVFVWSDKMNCAGTFDCVGNIHGVKFLIDFKTSKGFYEPSMPLQLSAYAKAYEERTKNKIEGIGILRLDKTTGMPFFKDYTDERKKYTKMFWCLSQYYKVMSEEICG